MKSPKIGIVSGVGPLAGADVLAKVFQVAAEKYGAVDDHEYPDVAFVNHGIPGVDNTATLSNMFCQEIANMITQLENQDATILGIACNTAHVYANIFEFQTSTTFVHLVDEVAQKAAQNHADYLLLTSNASREQRLYQGYLEKYSVSFQETTDEQQLLIDQAIGLVMAHKLNEAGRVMTGLFKAAQAASQTIIAGCTELPIALQHCPNTAGVAIIDSNHVLAESLARQYYESEGGANLLH